YAQRREIETTEEAKHYRSAQRQAHACHREDKTNKQTDLYIKK
ncbi:4768_t:CDS:1, partial [Racocetra persica]